MESQPIFSGPCISLYTITSQAEDFFAGLDSREARDLEVAATVLDTSFRLGRPPGGRAERVMGSDAGLWELRVTPQGRKGPHTRCMYICQQRELLIVRGVRKAQRGIARRDIELAERDVKLWREARDERKRGADPRGSP